MLTLLIDTCTARSIVAIVDGGRCLYAADLPVERRHSKYLLPGIEEGLALARKEVADLDLIAVGRGPGFYTGIRVGVITGKIISYARKIPLVGVCSLKGFVPAEEGFFAAVIDAKMSGFFLLAGKKEGDSVTYLSEPQLCSVRKFEGIAGHIPLIVTPDAASVEKKLAGYYTLNRWRIEESAPDPLNMAKIAEKKYRKGEYSLDGKVEIIYMRK